MALIVLVALVAAGCGGDPMESEAYRSLEQELAAVREDRDHLSQELAVAQQLPPILQEFKAAYESGDLEQVQGLYTEDGIWATTADIHDLYYGTSSHLGRWGVDGAEFRRVATLHSGQLDIFEPVVVGERAVAFGWRWSDFASGTGTLHLRDGRIVVATLTVTNSELSPGDPTDQ